LQLTINKGITAFFSINQLTFNQTKGEIMESSFINRLIGDITITLGLHTDSIPEDIHSECFCGTPEVIGKCYYCQMKENVYNLSESIKTLNEYSMNTSNLLHLIDAEAFRYALEKSGRIHSINCYPIYPNIEPDSELDPDPKPITFAIDVTTSRFAMNGTGYHIGYEVVTFQWKAINKSELGIHSGLPYLLSKWVINPDEFEIINKDLPINEDPNPNDHHDPDCEFKGQPFEDNECDCLDNWDGYFRPEDDFFYQDMQSIVSMLKYPDAEFDSDKREWTLGDISFNLNEFESNDEYKDGCLEDNGMPFTY
jgi:hypothetical protein